MKFNLHLTGHVHVRMKTDRQTKEMENGRKKKRRNGGVIWFSVYKSNTIRNTYRIVCCALTSAFLLLDRGPAAEALMAVIWSLLYLAIRTDSNLIKLFISGRLERLHQKRYSILHLSFLFLSLINRLSICFLFFSLLPITVFIVVRPIANRNGGSIPCRQNYGHPIYLWTTRRYNNGTRLAAMSKNDAHCESPLISNQYLTNKSRIFNERKMKSKLTCSLAHWMRPIQRAEFLQASFAPNVNSVSVRS